MPSVTLAFSNPINVSLQAGVGDVVYYQTNNTTTITTIGECTAIDTTNNSITCNINNGTPLPVSGDFIFFGKENIVNTSGLIGYQATIDMQVTSSSQKELFAVTSEVFISS